MCLSTPGNSNPNDPNASEDCLFLDIYAPSGATADSNLAVYVFLPGGGFNAIANANYNGSGLVLASEMNIIVVTVNYRVGVFGFLSGAEVINGASVNNGLKDQRKALEWVQLHISKVRDQNVPSRNVLG